jgi:hypothetical protein
MTLRSKALLVVILLILLPLSSAYLSFQRDLEAMGEGNLLLLIVDDTPRDRLLLAIAVSGSEEGERVFLLDPRERVGDRTLRSYLFYSTEGLRDFPGRAISRYYDPDPEKREEGWEIGRVVLIHATFLADLLDDLGGVSVRHSIGTLTLFRTLKGRDLLQILRGEDYTQIGIWQVEIRNPETNATETVRLAGPSLDERIRAAAPHREWRDERPLLLTTLTESLVEETLKEEDSRKKTLRQGLEGYKKGEIEIHPRTPLTRLLDLAPVGLAQSLIWASWEGS